MQIKVRKAQNKDFDFAFGVKKQALGPHIISKWGWDKVYQLTVHRQRWNEKPWCIVLFDDVPAGTISIQDLKTHIQFGEFYLLKHFQNKGFGTQILTNCLADSDRRLKKVLLEYLKWNPVGTLYQRHGFYLTHENQTHYFMQRDPKQMN